jgi:DNA-binding transcriptional MerR regulator
VTSHTIGEVLNQLRDEFEDVTISKIRFLESEGLINPDRTESGYRKFTPADVERLRYVLRAQRDRYLPLKVIRSELDRIDAGLPIEELAGSAATTSAEQNGVAPPPGEAVPAAAGERMVVVKREPLGLRPPRPGLAPTAQHPAGAARTGVPPPAVSRPACRFPPPRRWRRQTPPPPARAMRRRARRHSARPRLRACDGGRCSSPRGGASSGSGGQRWQQQGKRHRFRPAARVGEAPP